MTTIIRLLTAWFPATLIPNIVMLHLTYAPRHLPSDPKAALADWKRTREKLETWLGYRPIYVGVVSVGHVTPGGETTSERMHLHVAVLNVRTATLSKQLIERMWGMGFVDVTIAANAAEGLGSATGYLEDQLIVDKFESRQTPANLAKYTPIVKKRGRPVKARRRRRPFGLAVSEADVTTSAGSDHGPEPYMGVEVDIPMPVEGVVPGTDDSVASGVGIAFPAATAPEAVSVAAHERAWIVPISMFDAGADPDRTPGRESAFLVPAACLTGAPNDGGASGQRSGSPAGESAVEFVAPLRPRAVGLMARFGVVINTANKSAAGRTPAKAKLTQREIMELFHVVIGDKPKPASSQIQPIVAAVMGPCLGNLALNNPDGTSVL